MAAAASILTTREEIRALEEEIETLQQLREEQAKDVQFSEFIAPLAALAAKDLETWATASRDAKTAARELGVELSVAVKMDHLTRAVHKFAETSALTAIVMREIGTQAAALGVPLEDLPPELKNIVTWLNRTKKATGNYTAALQAARKEAAGIPDTTGEQIRAARDLGVAMEEVSKKFRISTEALKIYLGELAELGDGVGTLSDEVQTLVDRLRGTGVIQAAHNWAAALDRVWGLTTLTNDETAQLVTTLETAIAKWRALGKAVPTDVFERFMEASDRVRLNPPEQVFTQMGFEIADLHPTAIRAAHQQRLQAFRDMLDTTRLRAFADMGPIGIPLEPEIPPRFRTKIKQTFQGFGAEIGQTFARALEGGGGFLGAAKSLGVQGGTRLGEALSGGLAKRLTAETGFFSKGIGNFFGKAMGQAIPFVGPLIGLGIGKIFGAFKKPSEAELAARKQVKDYEDTLIAGLSASQLDDAADAAQGPLGGERARRASPHRRPRCVCRRRPERE